MTQPDRKQALSLSLLQTATYWHDPVRNRALFDHLFTQLPSCSRLVVLPEMFSTGFTMQSTAVAEEMDGETVTWLLSRARSLQKMLCGSLVIVDEGHYFNRFVCAYPDGRLQWYDKRHLFRMAGEHEHYSPGVEKVVLTVDGWRVCPTVCYDLRFPVWLRNQNDYDLLVCCANWPAARIEAWKTLLRARAIENQSYVAGVNIVGRDGNRVEYAGGSGVYGPAGQVMAEVTGQAKVINQTILWAPLAQLREEFPVWQDADPFIVR